MSPTATTETKSTYIKGGMFMVSSVEPPDVFTPEDFTEEHRMIAATTDEFMVSEVLPHLEALEHKDFDLQVKLMRKAGELGLLSVEIPEAYGGMGLDKSSSMLVSEKLARHASFSVTHGGHTGIGTQPIVYFGTEAQKKAYLPRLATGELLAAYALTEAGSGSDALAAKATAVLSADGKTWTLAGEKAWITNGGFADVFIVFAKVDGDKFSCFIVEKGDPGVSTGKEEKKMGIRGSSTRVLVLNDAKIPADRLLGEIGKGHKVAFNILNMGRFKLGAGCVGGAKVCIVDALAYASQRHQFGRPIASFGAIQHKLAEMAIRTWVAEAMVYRTAGLIDTRLAMIDKGDPVQVLAGIEEYAVECSVIKVYASEMLDYVVDEGVQIYGGYGYSEEYPAERYYRDSRINRIFEGTNEINRMLIPGMLVKRAMKGEIPLMPATQKVMEEVLSFPELSTEDEELLAAETKIAANAKKIGLLIAGAAFQRFQDKLQDQQEVLISIANVVMEAYACESAVLRAKKLVAASGEAGAELAADATRVFCADAMARVDFSARAVMAALAEGDMLRTHLAALRRFTKVTPVNGVAIRRKIAKKLLETGRSGLS